MSKIIPFDAAGSAVAPAYLKKRADASKINDEIQVGASFNVISIKGKVFAIVKDGERKIITKPDDPDEVAQHIGVVILRANTKARTFYAKRFTEDDGEGKRPTCYSMDGVTPAADAEEPQAKKCQLCPHAAFGTREREDGTASKGSACSQNIRMAVATPDNPKEPFLLRVPPASIKAFRELIRIAKSRDIPYNALIVRLGFDKEAAAPKLTFKPVGFVPEEMYETVEEMYEDDIVAEITGKMTVAEHQADQSEVETEELDAAIAAREATAKAKASTKAKPKAATDDEDEPEEAVKPAKPAKAATKPAKAADDEDEGEDAPPPPKAAKAASKPAKAAKPADDEDDDEDAGSLVDELKAMLGDTDD